MTELLATLTGLALLPLPFVAYGLLWNKFTITTNKKNHIFHLVFCSRTYNELWADAQLELSRLLAEELPAEPPRPEKDRVVFFQRLAMLYVRYIQIFRQLERVYDQVVHPQKRRVIRAILDGVRGRVLELKNEMVEKEFSEYHYMDDVLHDLKLTPVSFIFIMNLPEQNYIDLFTAGAGFIRDDPSIMTQLNRYCLYCHLRQTLRSPSLATSSVIAAKNSENERRCWQISWKWWRLLKAQKWVGK